MVADTFRFILADRGRRRLKADLGIKGQIRAFEVTHGARGWHRISVVLFLEGDLPPDALGRVQLYLVMWKRMVMAQGFRAPDPVHGVKAFSRSRRVRRRASIWRVTRMVWSVGMSSRGAI